MSSSYMSNLYTALFAAAQIRFTQYITIFKNFPLQASKDPKLIYEFSYINAYSLNNFLSRYHFQTRERLLITVGYRTIYI